MAVSVKHVRSVPKQEFNLAKPDGSGLDRMDPVWAVWDPNFSWLKLSFWLLCWLCGTLGDVERLNILPKCYVYALYV
jgi:hypothetical protein